MIRSEIKALMQNPPAHLTHTGDDGVLLGTIGCLEFNLEGIPFPGWSTAEQRRSVARQTIEALHNIPRFKWRLESEIKDLSTDERLILLEREQITGVMANRDEGGYTMLTENQDTLCFINEEEHVLLQSFYPGARSFQQAVRSTGDLLFELGERLQLAYDPRFGYLTSDPTKGGEASFFSMMMYLPASRITNHIPQIQEAMDELGQFFSAIVPILDDPVGDFYLLHSPAVPCGALERTTVETQMTLASIVKNERAFRKQLKSEQKYKMKVCAEVEKAYERITTAKRLKYVDMVKDLCSLRLGISMGLLRVKSGSSDDRKQYLARAFTVNAPRYMCLIGGLSGRNERREERARYARELVCEKLQLEKKF